MTMLINLCVSVGLLAAATFIVDTIALYLCPTRALVRQYKTRVTGDFEHIREVFTSEMKQEVGIET